MLQERNERRREEREISFWVVAICSERASESESGKMANKV